MKKFLLFCLMVLIAGWQLATAQDLEDYQFQAVSNATYTSIADSGTAISCTTDDSNGPVTWPFDFTFAGTTYTTGQTMYVVSNGYIALDASVTSTTPTGTTSGFISPFGHDMNPANSSYSTTITGGKTAYYKVSGTAPNRVLTIEWFDFPSYSTPVNVYNFQVKFYETTNVIEFCYGTQTINATSKTPYVLLRHHATGGYLVVKNLAGSTDWSTFTMEEATTYSTLSLTSSSCPQNLIYRFTPVLPICPKINNLHTEGFTTSSITVGWTAVGDETSWEVVCRSITDTNNVFTATASTNPYTIQGLNSDEQYMISVASVCSDGSGTSLPRTITAITLPAEAAELPYSCNFEDATENANWTLYNGNAANHWMIGSGTSYGNEGQSMFVTNDGEYNAYYYDSAAVVYAVRDIYLTPGYDNYAIEFDWKAMGQQATDYFRLYIGREPASVTPNTTGTVTAPANSVSLTINGIGTLGLTPEWRHTNLVLDSTWSGKTMRLYFTWVNNAIVGLNPPVAIDNIHVTGHTCPAPTLTHFYDSIPGIYTLTWSDENNAGTYEVALVPYYGGDPNISAVTVNDMEYTFTDVVANQPYLFYIRSVCSSTEKSRWMSYNLGMSCDMITSLPYEEDFDTYGTPASGLHTECMTHNTNSTTAYPYISSTQRASGIGSLYFYGTTSTWSYVALPQIDVNSLDITEMMLSLKAYITSTTTTYGRFDVGVMTDPMDETTFTTVRSFNHNDFVVSTWMDFNVYFNNYTGNGEYIAIRVPAEGTNNLYIDNVVLKAVPTCSTPTNLTASNVSDNSANISWTVTNPAAGYELAILSPAGAAMETATIESTPLTHTVLENLTANTDYLVYVRSVCGSDYSEWAGPVSVKTKCLPEDELPYEEGFEGVGGSGSAFFPGCWTRHTNNPTQNPYVSSSYYASGTSSLYFYGNSSTYYCMAASQGLDLSQGEGDYILTFKLYKTSSSYGRLDVGVMTDPDNMNTLTVLKSIYPTDLAATSTWYEFQVIVPAQTEGTSYLAFYMPQGASNYLYLDDVKLDAASCSSPSNLTVSNVNGTSAYVTWDAAPVAVDDYTVEYTEAGMDTWTPYVTSETSYLISALTQGTAYEVRLFSNCMEGNADTLTASFTTSTYIGCSEPDTIGTTIGNGSTTTYYVPVNNLYNYTYSQQIYTADEINPAHTPTVITALAFNYSYGTPMTDKNNVDIYLAHRTDSTFAGSSDWTPIANAQLVYHGDLNCSQGWNVFELDDFFSYNGTDNLVVIVNDKSGDYNSSTYVFSANSKTNAVLYLRQDGSAYNPAAPGAGTTYSIRPDIKFYTCDQVVPLTCVAPNVYDYTADDESITLSWTAGLNETSWELRYKAAGTTEWNTVTVNASPYTIDELNASTEYTVELRSDCGSGEFSESVSLTISTTCASIFVPYTENFEGATGTSYANFVSCWSRGTNYSSSYPYVVTTQQVSGTNSLYFYGSSSTYCYAATPRFDDEVQMDSLLITFQARKSTASYYIEVGIMTDPNDYSTFQLVGSFTPSEINHWEMAEIKTNNYTGDGRYVAFRIPNWITSYMWVDDVLIDYIPQCQHVEDLEATNITAHEATISWTPGGDETEWLIVYALAGTINPAILEDADFTPVNSDSVVLTDLTSNTQYEVFVKASCSNGESSVVMSTSFYTACLPLETLPYSVDFDNYTHTTNNTSGNNNVPNCWGYRNTGTSSYSAYPYVYYSSTYAHSGNYSLAFYTYTSSTYSDQYAFLPEIDLSTLSFDNIALEFFMRSYSTSYTFQLIVGITEGMDISTFEAIDTLSMSSTTYAFKSVEFTGYTGTGNRIVLLAKKPTSGYNYGNLDDIALVSNTCHRPDSLAIVAHDASSVTLQWTEVGSATSWNIEYGVAGFAHGQGTTVEVTDNPYTVTGLESGTQYEFYVQSVCGSDDISAWSLNSVEVNTDMVAAELPYATDFEEGSDVAWMLVSGGAVNKWRIGSGDGTDKKLFVSNSPTAFSYSITSPASVYAQKLFTMGLEDSVCVSFDVKMGGESSYDYIKVLLIPTTETIASGAFNSRLTDGHLGNYTSTLYAFNFLPYDAQSTGSLSASYPCIFNLTGGQTVHVEGKLLNPAPGAEAYLVFYWNNDVSGGSAPAAIIDNISVRADSSSLHSCSRPGQLSVDNITTSSATISWTSTATQFTLYYKLSTSNTYDSIPNITQTTYELTNLMAGVEYDFYVLGICSDGEELASSVFSFPTQCGAITIPYTQNFDNQTTGSGTLPQCWSRNSTYNATTPYISTSYHNSGNASLYFYCSTATDNMVVLPPVDPTVNPVNTLQLSFVSRATSLAPPHFVVGVMTDPNDATTFVGVDTITHTVATQFESFEVPLSSYSGTGTYVAIYYYCSGTATSCYVDDVVLEEMPSCPKPIHLAAMSATTSTIALTWESFGATSWEIAYGAPGFDPDAATANVVTANTNPFTVSNLSTATSYEFYVRAICSNAESSPWSASLIAATTCDVVNTFPYTEGFEAGGSMPACWSQEYVVGSLDWQFQNGGHSSSSISSAHGGSYNAYLYTTSDYTTKLVSPIFDLSNMTDAYVTFWHAQQVWVSDQDQLTVYYRTSATSQWTQLAQYTSSLSVWTFDSIALPNPSATYQLAFEGYATYGYGVDLDDITVNGTGGPGPVITDPSVTTNVPPQITQTSASLSATITNPDGVTISAKGFAWKPASGTTYTQITGTGTGNNFTANLTGLTPNTDYNVKAFITYNGTQIYGNEVNFTTLEQGQPTEPSATTADATNVTTNSATLNGSIANPDGVAITSQGFEWKAASESTYATVTATGATMTYNLSNLAPNTEYTYRAFVTTAAGTHRGSDVTFTTEAEPVEPCDAPVNVHASDITHESMTISWDANPAVSSWKIQYGPQNGVMTSATTGTNSYALTGLLPETTYEVRVQADCGDGNISVWSEPIYPVTLTGINSYLENSVVLYPNPAKEVVNVQCTMNNVQFDGAEVEVLDVYGKLIQTLKIDSETTQINVSGLANGMYFVRVTTEQGVVTKRFVKR